MTSNCMQRFEPPEDAQVERAPEQAVEAIVAIPVRNEAGSLTACLASLVRQVDLAGRSLDPSVYEILLLLNNCMDGSATVLRNFINAQRHVARPMPRIHLLETALTAGQDHVGWARRLIMDEAYRRFRKLGRATGIITTTDADTVVAPNWIAAIRAEMKEGADAVGGRLLLSPWEQKRLPKTLQAIVIKHRTYERLCDHLVHHTHPDPADPWPRHSDHAGASLAVTAAAYECVGGVPPVPFGEDEALYRGLLGIGARFRHSDRTKVFTSGRLLGRAAGGMATQLLTWAKAAATGEEILVAPPLEAAQRVASSRTLPAPSPLEAAAGSLIPLSEALRDAAAQCRRRTLNLYLA
jgi:Glycosyl transferase family 2